MLNLKTPKSAMTLNWSLISRKRSNFPLISFLATLNLWVSPSWSYKKFLNYIYIFIGFYSTILSKVEGVRLFSKIREHMHNFVQYWITFLVSGAKDPCKILSWGIVFATVPCLGQPRFCGYYYTYWKKFIEDDVSFKILSFLISLPPNSKLKQSIDILRKSLNFIWTVAFVVFHSSSFSKFF